ncbi:hypothetical protein HPP92_018761 [Vanilla planifolia]|nr:hypothetical protein HPP92_018761 [Vanilla planifolia]
MSSSARSWWRCAAGTVKDKQSLYLTQLVGHGQRAEIDAAVIRATSHDERSVDNKNAARVFALARTSPACLKPLMSALSRRARRTRSWAVALKILLLAHGVLLCSSAAPRVGRLPFDLSDFHDRSARPSSTSYGFSAFVRSYFQYLDYRSVLLSSFVLQHSNDDDKGNTFSFTKLVPVVAFNVSTFDDDLGMVVKMQKLLDLLMQIRPYANGMEVGLILEAMDCVVIEIFEVYGSICSSIASFLVDVGPPSYSVKRTEKTGEERRRMGIAGMQVLRRAVEQSDQLSSFFDLCRRLGVPNAAEIPPIESIPQEDIRNLEALVLGDIHGIPDSEIAQAGREEEEKARNDLSHQQSATVVTKKWEVFEDEATSSSADCCENAFFTLDSEEKTQPTSSPWASSVPHHAVLPYSLGHMIELI